jgi:hypothetical protein
MEIDMNEQTKDILCAVAGAVIGIAAAMVFIAISSVWYVLTHGAY